MAQSVERILGKDEVTGSIPLAVAQENLRIVMILRFSFMSEFYFPATEMSMEVVFLIYGLHPYMV